MKKSKKRLVKTKKTSPKKIVAKKSISKSRRSEVGTPTRASGNKSGIMPLGERVLVKPFTADEMMAASGKTTSFGIIIPDTVDKEKSEQGMVVAVGPGKKTDDGNVISLSVQPGDKIMFSKYGFDEIKVNGVEYYILPESSILAILD